MLVYPDAQILDITGPLEVFSRSARWLRDNKYTGGLPYEVCLTAKEAGPIRTSSGLCLLAEKSIHDVQVIDTLMVTGGVGFDAAANDDEIIDWLSRSAASAKRVASVCTGSLILARAGLLDGLNVTTHWAYCEKMQSEYCGLVVDDDAIFKKNNNIYTSAGVTTGMDMALAMVEEDWGTDVSLAIAQELVLYLKRSGGQSQISRFLQAQLEGSTRFPGLRQWILDNMASDLSVDALANRAGMSKRNFARHFVQEYGVPPARYVEKIRVHTAKVQLEESVLSLGEIAELVGLSNADVLTKAFRRAYGAPPSVYRSIYRQSFKKMTPGGQAAS